MNFLIVDDSTTVKKSVTAAIKKDFPEAKVVEASNGKEAFHELTRNHFDIIITDFEMDEGDGGSFAMKLKGNSILRKKPLIFFTSSPEKVKEIFGESVAVVNKTSGTDVLRKNIKEILG